MVERGRTKCTQYWNPEPGHDVQVSGFTITTLEVDKNRDYTISMLLITNTKVHIYLCNFTFFITKIFCYIYFYVYICFRLMRQEKFVICSIRHGQIMVFLSRLQLYCSSCLW